ncbi:MAG: CusA/CzcA family heavy metal efflux RND transporter [Bacteroidales bacterium]|nr:CusA/CzcA family heavy metal efflux RND transporter [Bacteroidales bacterium]
MFNAIIRFSLRNKLIIILFTITILGFGIYSLIHLPVGAVPDITNNQVQVITVSPNLATQDVEQFITYPVELEMSNLPGVKEIRSISKFGLSVVTVVFEEKMGTWLPRQLISEKIKAASAKIPEGFGTPEMGPITTGLGEIYQYILDVKPGFENRYSPMELRTIQDWIVKRQLSGIPGVVEINTWGGYLKQYEIAANPHLLAANGISINELYQAVAKNNDVAGGAYIEKAGKSYFIRGDGLVHNLDDLKNIVIKSRNGIPLKVSDVAEVRFGHANRFGAITANGQGEKVLGQVMMLKGANSMEVINEVKKRVKEVEKTLPEGIYINPIVDRSELIHKTTTTVIENLSLGIIIVMLVVFLLLGNLRAGLVIASIIPLALMITFSLMSIFHIDANLMSLGALDFGVIIDGAVIIVEFIMIKVLAASEELTNSDKSYRKTLMDRISFEGSSKMLNSAIFGQLIILIVFIPILSLTGVEGKMFRPMALTFSFALLGAMIMGFTWLPVASALFLRPGKTKKTFTEKIMNLAYKTYTPSIEWAYHHKKWVLGAGFASLILAGIVFTRLGGEFVPTLDEGDFVIQPVLRTGTSLSETIRLTTRMEQILKEKFPNEVEKIVCRIGAAEVPTDPMSMEEIDMIIKLYPKKQWKAAKNKEELANRFKEALSRIPGIDYEFTQPIEMRFNELITGVRSDLAVKVFGEDLNILAGKAREIKSMIEKVPGAADVIIEKTEGLPQMAVKYDRQQLARYGLDVFTLNQSLTAAFGGSIAGVVFEGEKRFDLVVRLKENFRQDIENLKKLPISLPNGTIIPLSAIADINYTTGPARISRDMTHRRIVVSVNVRNRDLQSVVKDVQQIIEQKVSLPTGYYVTYGGQFENLQNALNRLEYIVPISIALIFIFLHFAFQSFRDAFMIFTAIPLALVGGVFALWVRGMPFSISAAVGFIALFGIAVLNGIVLIEHLKELKEHGISDMKERIMKGTRQRLRPVMLTASAAAMGFLPMAVSTSAGAEVQRPLATVVIGGLFTSGLLTMIALPLLYAILDDVKGFTLWPPRLIRSSRPLLVLIPLLMPLFIYSQQVKVITPDEAIKIAQQNNAGLMAERAMTKAAGQRIHTAWNFGPTTVYHNYDQNNIAENGYPLRVWGISQQFEFPLTYSLRKKVLNEEFNIQQALTEVRENELDAAAFKAWWNLKIAGEKLKLNRQTDSIYSLLVIKAQALYEQGERNRLSYLAMKSKQQRAHADLLKVMADVKNAHTTLQSILNTSDSLVPADIPIDIELLSNIETLPDPGYKLFELRLKHAKAVYHENLASFLPGFSAEVFNGTNNFDGNKNYKGYQLGLSLPLWFFPVQHRVKQHKLQQDAAYYYLLDYQNRRKAKLSTLKSRLETLKTELQTLYSLRQELMPILAITSQKGFETGELSFFEAMAALEEALTIHSQYLETQLNYMQTYADYKYFNIE